MWSGSDLSLDLVMFDDDEKKERDWGGPFGILYRGIDNKKTNKNIPPCVRKGASRHDSIRSLDTPPRHSLEESSALRYEPA